MYLKYLANIAYYIPEMVAVLSMVALILVEVTYGSRDKGSQKGYIFWTSLLGLGSVFVLLVLALGDKPTTAFTNAVTIDKFSTFMKITMVLGTLGAIYLAKSSLDIYENLKSEFAILAVGTMIGGMILASANNMLMLYLGIETLSILSYAMAALKRRDAKSSEAGLKYTLYGGVSAGVMLFGMSHIFGVLGTIDFTGIATSLKGLDEGQLMILVPSFLLFFVGLGYKVAAVPFHMWSPDVYEGSPLPVTTFFAIVPKLAGIAAIARVTAAFNVDGSVLSTTWIGLLSIAAALTMTVGNVAAIGQKSIKRMLAYSSISHAGVLMLGALVVTEIGTRSLVFYGVTYLFMTLSAFFIVGAVADKYGNDHFERFNGLMSKHPIMSIAMIITMLSLAGLPPLSGFVAKFHVLNAVVAKKYYALAIVFALNSVVSLYYYMKIIRLMVFEKAESEEEIPGFNFMGQAVICAVTLPVLFLGIYWETIMKWADGAKLYIP